MTSPDRKIAFAAGFSHMFCHGFMTIFTGVLIVLASEQSMGYFALGMAANIAYFLFGFGSIPAGLMVDRHGSHRMLVFSLLGMSVSSALIGLSPHIVVFAIAFGLMGFFASVYHPAGLSLVTKHLAKPGKALGLHGVLGNVGLAGAPLAAGIIVKLTGSWRAAYFAFAAFGFLFALVVWRMSLEGEEKFRISDAPTLLGDMVFSFGGRRSSAPSEVRVGESGGAIPVSLVLLYVGCVFFGLVYRGSVTFFPALFASEVNAIAVSDNPALYAGMLTSAVLFAGVIGQWAGGMFVVHLKRPEFGHIIIFAIAVPTLWFVGRVADTPLVAWAIAFNTVFYAWQPVQNGLVAKYTSKGARGLGYGLNFFLLMGVGSIATAIGGWIADEYGVYKIYQVLWYLAAASLAVSLMVLRFSQYRIKVKLQYELVTEDK